jgi:hypothetical protein
VLGIYYIRDNIYIVHNSTKGRLYEVYVRGSRGSYTLYTEGSCSQTEAARRAGYEFPAVAANKMLNGKDMPHVTKAIRIRQEY